MQMVIKMINPRKVAEDVDPRWFSRRKIRKGGSSEVDEVLADDTNTPKI